MLVGIVTVDDVMDVAEEEVTEDIQKMAAVSALEAPYLDVRLPLMIRKRAAWLAVLFVGEMLTATAMGYFEGAIEKVIALTLFIPLIISSGGNSGSQTASIIIRALALEEVKMRDWLRVLFRELASGLALGCILGVIALARVLFWPWRLEAYGPLYGGIAFTVAAALVGVVAFGTLTGAMLPIILKRLGFDPAISSTPFVATLVDVSGVIIYFTVASALLL
jgi:magnesium transporter